MPLYNHFYNSSAPLGRYGVIVFSVVGEDTDYGFVFYLHFGSNQIVSVYVFVFIVNIVNKFQILILILHNKPIFLNKILKKQPINLKTINFNYLFNKKIKNYL